MNRKYLIANSVLWASAIIASAVVGAPTYFSVVLLPALAAISLLLAVAKSSAMVAKCARD